MAILNNFPANRPALHFNFARLRALDPRIAFSRASVGTYVGADGLIKTAASGVPRFDHDPVTGESLGLLIEEARTNSKRYSQDFTIEWQQLASILDTTQVAPDGSTTATTLSLPIANARLQINNTDAGSSPGTWTFSVWMRNVNPGTASITLLLQTTLGASTGTTVTVTNQWQRFSTTQEVISSGGIQIRNSTTDNYTIEVWGAQLEAGSFPTSYIPTTTTSVSRAADIATISNTNSALFPTSSFTVINSPFGTVGGGSTVKLVGPTIKRTAIYSGDLSQAQINALAEVNDNFWRWRVLGSSFALPNFTTNGSVTVDWGDGVVETLTTAEHTFTNGGGYHDIGFRLNSGTFFKPAINANATYKDRVIAVGPAPVSMKLDPGNGFQACSALRGFDATVDTSVSTNFVSAWNGCSSLTSFPLINTAATTNFQQAWAFCSSLTSFPAISTGAGTNFQQTWRSCSSLTSFPSINTAAGTNFYFAWADCSNLTSFPLINTAAATTFGYAWYNCSKLTSFPANMFDTTGTLVATAFTNAFANCALTATSVENILTSLVTNGQSNITLYLNGSTNANTSTWSTAARNAYITLISRGWTITQNGTAPT